MRVKYTFTPTEGTPITGWLDGDAFSTESGILAGMTGAFEPAAGSSWLGFPFSGRLEQPIGPVTVSSVENGEVISPPDRTSYRYPVIRTAIPA